jgi:hypothetical protein
MARRATLRASDADREQVAERLKRASTEGRLGAEELEQRLESALSARTYGDLDAVVADLPSSRRAHPRRSSRELASLRPALVAAVALPVVLAVTVVVVLAITGAFAAWVLWVAVGFFFFSRRRRRWMRYGGPPACGHWRGGRARLESSRGTWV